MSLIKEKQNNSPLKLWCSRGPSIYNQDPDGAESYEDYWEGIDTKIESEVFYYEENIENDNLSDFVRKIFEKIIQGLRVSTLDNIKKNGLEITIEKNVFFITYAP
tara:strand:+ start:1240 stop:1554 length:315 start_codon:yes stop_codon:yes gene_type:complete